MTQVDVETEISQWLSPVLSPNQSPVTLKPLEGDAGARRYFRLPDYPHLLACAAPPATENNRVFAHLTSALRAQGVHAPRIHAVDFDRGFLLIDHLGDRLYLADLDPNSVENLYGEAVLTLLQMQQIPQESAQVAPYDGEKLRAEMALFPEWFVSQLLGYQLSGAEQTMLERVFAELVASAVEQPQCFVHRDYHSRNLINSPVGPPGVIDYQDAVWGPVTYDLVSLLKDCYVRWPEESVRRWVLAYANMSVEVGILPPVQAQQFLRWFDWMGLQRHLKVLGIFARLNLRDHKPRYLQDLPLVIRYTLEAADRYPEYSTFGRWFRDTLIPLAAQQSWYRDYRSAGYSP